MNLLNYIVDGSTSCFLILHSNLKTQITKSKIKYLPNIQMVQFAVLLITRTAFASVLT